MKLFITVTVCKFVRFLGHLLGRGSSLPGKVSLRIYPDVLRCLKLPETIIAVTGSNGKTTTSEMIAHILKTGGLKVGHNREGSNQTDGIATLLLSISDYKGNVNCDALVLECDERYAVKIFKYVKPAVLLITNLCRDQLTRNGHSEFVAGCLRDAVEETIDKTTLVLNADDPLVMTLTHKNRPLVLFGVDKDAAPANSGKGLYDDGAYCPQCKEKMTYKYRTASHFGSFKCKACGFAHPAFDVRISNYDYRLGEAIINDKISMWITDRDINSLYNTAAAIASVKAAGINEETAARRLDKYIPECGRKLRFNISRRNVNLVICKHENSLAYNSALSRIVTQHKPCTLVIAVDSISRKYYTSETSWLWDIDFDLLSDDCVEEIILTGRYVNELMLRFAMSAVDMAKCSGMKDMSVILEKISSCKTDDIYILTCFSDKAKMLKSLKINFQE